MDDEQILDLYFERSERAIEETERKYGGYCFTLANARETFSRILSSMKNMGNNYVQMELIRSGLYSISIFRTGVLLTGSICAGEYEFCRYHGKYERSRFRKR